MRPLGSWDIDLGVTLRLYFYIAVQIPQVAQSILSSVGWTAWVTWAAMKKYSM